MNNRALTGVFMLLPFLASADTLILKDGTRFRGSFNNADTRRMTFTDEGGNRHDVSISDIQELRFGNDQQPYSRNDQQRYSRNDANAPSESVGPMGDIMDQLGQDLRVALDNNNFPPDQRRILENARDRLLAERDRNRNGRPADGRMLRSALDDIRNVADQMQREDRDRINGDVRRLSALMNGQQGRDY